MIQVIDPTQLVIRQKLHQIVNLSILLFYHFTKCHMFSYRLHISFYLLHVFYHLTMIRNISFHLSIQINQFHSFCQNDTILHIFYHLATRIFHVHAFDYSTSPPRTFFHLPTYIYPFHLFYYRPNLHHIYCHHSKSTFLFPISCPCHMSLHICFHQPKFPLHIRAVDRLASFHHTSLHFYYSILLFRKLCRQPILLRKYLHLHEQAYLFRLLYHSANFLNNAPHQAKFQRHTLTLDLLTKILCEPQNKSQAYSLSSYVQIIKYLPRLLQNKDNYNVNNTQQKRSIKECSISQLFLQEMRQNRKIKYLEIKLIELQVNGKLGETEKKYERSQSYFSFSLVKDNNEQMYFSSCMPKQTSALSDDIIISLPSNITAQMLQSMQLYLHRWQNHMIMFSLQIGIAQLKSRNIIIKKVQTKYGQILKMHIGCLSQQQIVIGDKFVSSINQHYLLVDMVQFVEEGQPSNNNRKENHLHPSYFKILTGGNNSNQRYILPVINAQVLIKIPQSLQFYYIKDGKQVSKSKSYNSTELSTNRKIIQMSSITGNNDRKVRVNLRWGINLQQIKPQNTLLLDSQQIMIYDIQVKFDNPTEYGNCKVKIIYGNKAFELGNQFNTKTKIKKIVNFMTKSEDQQVYVVVEKNVKVIVQNKFHLQQIVPFGLFTMKKKLIDANGKLLGYIKFKCQRAKNLSTPFNNKIWRDSIKKNNNVVTTFVIDQVSVKYSYHDPLILCLKTEGQEKTISSLVNIQYFSQIQIKQSPIFLALKPDESVYMIIKEQKKSHSSQSGSQDFVGIALFNPATCRLGTNCCQINFFKNQIQTVSMFCITNKIVSYPFIKPSFQPQLLQILSHRNISLSIIMRQVYFTPFFYTYQYDNKNQVYSIVEVNKTKKVLILQNKNKAYELSFSCSASSDNLDFNVQQKQTIRMKITFLVSDIGQDQQIYGSCIIKVKASELQAVGTSLKFYLVQIKNQHGSVVGQINMQVHKAALFNSYEKESRDILQSGTKGIQNEKRKVKMNFGQISQSAQIKEKSAQLAKNQISSINLKKSIPEQQTKKLHKLSNRYQPKIQASFSGDRKKRNNSVIGVQNSIKLPSIRQQSASPKQRKSFNELIQMMKIRKRSVKGHYQQNSMIQSYQNNNLTNLNNRRQTSKHQNVAHHQTIHLKQKIEKQNPNLVRNMQIIFPKKNPRIEKNLSVKIPISEQQQKLKGLKSVLKQITKDVYQIQPTVKNYGRNQNQSKRSQRFDDLPNNSYNQINHHMRGPQWQDNQFAS